MTDTSIDVPSELHESIVELYQLLRHGHGDPDGELIKTVADRFQRDFPGRQLGILDTSVLGGYIVDYLDALWRDTDPEAYKSAERLDPDFRRVIRMVFKDHRGGDFLVGPRDYLDFAQAYEGFMSFEASSMSMRLMWGIVRGLDCTLEVH